MILILHAENLPRPTHHPMPKSLRKLNRGLMRMFRHTVTQRAFTLRSRQTVLLALVVDNVVAPFGPVLEILALLENLVAQTRF
jgi:hypothetical protein